MKLHNRLKRVEEKMQPQNRECLTRIIYENPDTGERKLITEYTYKPVFPNTDPVMEIVWHMPPVEEEWSLNHEAE